MLSDSRLLVGSIDKSIHFLNSLKFIVSCGSIFVFTTVHFPKNLNNSSILSTVNEKHWIFHQLCFQWVSYSFCQIVCFVLDVKRPFTTLRGLLWVPLGTLSVFYRVTSMVTLRKVSLGRIKHIETMESNKIFNGINLKQRF